MRPVLQFCWLTLPFLYGCSNAREEKASASAPKVTAQKPQLEVVTQAGDATVLEVKPAAAQEPWGTIQGRIVWGGKEVKPRQPIAVKKDHNDYAFCMKDGEFLDETWIIDPKTKGLKNTFIWLAPTAKDGKLAIHPARAKIAASDERVVIDQPICMFVPHALALREGQVLVVKNTSKVLHNFKWGGDPDVNPGGNPAIPAGGEEVLKIKADRFPIAVECGVHPWMKGWIRAFDHPYFAVTDAEGRFEIKDAPGGPCRLIVWHSEGWLGGAKGRNGQPITIQPGTNDLGAIEYPEPPPRD